MKDQISPQAVFRWAVAAGLGLLAVWVGASVLYLLRDVLVEAAVALFIAVSLDPAVRWLVGRGLRRSYAVTLIFVIALIVVVGLVAAVVPPLVRQASNLSQDLPGYIDTITERSRAIREFGERFGFTQNLRELAADLPAIIGTHLLTFLRGVFGAIITALTVMVLTIYFMADLPRLRSGVVRLFPPSARRHARRTVDVVVDKVGAYMIGNLLISLIAGISTYVALTLIGVPFALPLALMVAITDLIPMIGATLGAVLCVLVSALAAPLWPTTALVALFFLVYQQVENYVIAPYVLRDSVDLPAVAVLLAGIIGGTVLGLIGALMAIPLAAVIKVLFTEKIRTMDAAEEAALAEARLNAAEVDVGELDRAARHAALQDGAARDAALQDGAALDGATVGADQPAEQPVPDQPVPGRRGQPRPGLGSPP